MTDELDITIPSGPLDGWRLGPARWWEAMTEGLVRGSTLTVDGVDYEAPEPWEPSYERALRELAYA